MKFYPFKIQNQNSLIRKKWFYLLLISILISCEKQTLEPQINSQSIIFFKADFNGVHVEYKAGDNNIIASTYNSYLYHDSMVTYHCLLKNLYNSSIKYIDIGFFGNFFPYKNVLTDIDSTIIKGSYIFNSPYAQPGNPNHKKEVSIWWYNSHQSFYSTYNAGQKYSYFKITEVKDTLLKTQTESKMVKMATIDFKCRLINKYYDTINVTNGVISAIFK